MGYWQSVLVEPAKTIMTQISQFLINILLVVFILIIGWLIAKLIKATVVKGLRAIKVDQWSDRLELDNLMAKGGISYSLSELIGVVFYWFALLITFVVAVNAVGLTIAAELLNRVILYIPNIVAAIFILILGMFVATLLKNIIKTGANNAGIAQANLLSKVVEIFVYIFIIAIALEQLNIGAKIIELIVSILLGSLGLGLAIAFGLGCKDIVGRFIGELVEKMKSQK